MRLISTTMPRIGDLLIPRSIKRQALEGFVGLTDVMDMDTLEFFAENRANIWDNCVPPELRIIFRQHAGRYRTWIKLAPPDMILDWIGEARPRMVDIILRHRQWFEEQVADLKVQVLSGTD